MIRRLEIPHSLVGSGEATLQIAYQKYEAFLSAFRKYTVMKNNGSWEGKKPTKTDFMEIFASKSYFHSHYNTFFPKVVDYLVLQAWLRNGEGSPSNDEVWGLHKEVYNFKDLKIFLENKGSLVDEFEVGVEGKKKGKGKGKEKEKDERGEGLKKNHKKKDVGKKVRK